MCQNVYVQREIPRKTILAYSNLMGMGLFMGEPVKKDQFIGEYKGEILTQEEAERRGKIYDKRGTSFLFDLNTAQTLDATRMGNKLRFINHSATKANCKAQVVMANCVHRIGFWATENLRAGEELYFDYGYSNKAVKFVQLEPPYIPWSSSSGSESEGDKEGETIVAKPQARRGANKNRFSGGKGTTERSRKMGAPPDKGKGKLDEESSEYDDDGVDDDDEDGSGPEDSSDSNVPIGKRARWSITTSSVHAVTRRK